MLEGIVAGVIARSTIATASEVHDRVRQFRQADDPVAAAFNDALADRIETRSKEIDSLALHNVAQHWNVITEEIDTYGTVFESEADAIDWLVEEVTSHESVDLDEGARTELRTLIADEYADAVSDFRKQVANDEALRQDFQEDLGITILDRLNALRRGFRQIADPEAYTLYEFPAQRDEILNTLFPDETIPFAERPEVPDTPTPDKQFVIGPLGAGKSRIIAEHINRFPTDAFDFVLIPDENRFLSQEDARALGRQSFDGDLLLIWEDLHKVEQGQQTGVIKRTLAELNEAVGDNELYTLLEARSGQTDTLPGTFPEDFDNEDSFWSDLTPLWTAPMPEESLQQMIRDRMAETDSVELAEGAEKALIKRTRTAESAPTYIKAAIEAVKETDDQTLTVAEVEDLPDTVAEIWQNKVYEKLRQGDSGTWDAEWDVLVAMKLLYDLNVPQVSKLVHEIYLDDTLVAGDPSRFKTAVKQLAETRGWLTVVTTGNDDLLATETRYVIHDAQLEAISKNASDQMEPLSSVLRQDMPAGVPEEARAAIQFNAGVAFYEYDASELAEKHWHAAIREAPEDARAHSNYALLLDEEFNAPKDAAEHYEQALEIDPEYADAHYNYALLLDEEFNAPKDAAEHYEQALEIDPEGADAQDRKSTRLNSSH